MKILLTASTVGMGPQLLPKEMAALGLGFPLLSKRINLHFHSEHRTQILAHALLFIAARPRGAGQGNHTGARQDLILNGICGF